MGAPHFSIASSALARSRGSADQFHSVDPQRRLTEEQRSSIRSFGKFTPETRKRYGPSRRKSPENLEMSNRNGTLVTKFTKHMSLLKSSRKRPENGKLVMASSKTLFDPCDLRAPVHSTQ